jgi:gas vesicle protein
MSINLGAEFGGQQPPMQSGAGSNNPYGGGLQVGDVGAQDTEFTGGDGDITPDPGSGFNVGDTSGLQTGGSAPLQTSGGGGGGSWIGGLISSAAGLLSANQARVAQEQENEHNQDIADKLNKIKLQQYEREMSDKEQAQWFEENEQTVKEFEDNLNKSQALTRNLQQIWGSR